MKDYNKFRKYETNLDYFKSWSPKMAYILGFITADGYIKDDGKSYALMISLSQKDLPLLQFIQSEISPNCPIKLFERKTELNNLSKMAKLSISSKEIVKDLGKLQVFGQKSGREKYPNVPKEFIGDYLRGFLDGDGCISNTSNCLSIIYVCTNREYLEKLQNCVDGLGNIYIRKTRIGNPLFVWQISAQKDVEKFKNIIYYPNHPFALKRKLDKIKDFKVRVKPPLYEYRHKHNSFIFSRCAHCDIIFSHPYKSKNSFCSQDCKFKWRKIHASSKMHIT